MSYLLFYGRRRACSALRQPRTEIRLPAPARDNVPKRRRQRFELVFLLSTCVGHNPGSEIHRDAFAVREQGGDTGAFGKNIQSGIDRVAEAAAGNRLTTTPSPKAFNPMKPWM